MHGFPMPTYEDFANPLQPEIVVVPANGGWLVQSFEKASGGEGDYCIGSHVFLTAESAAEFIRRQLIVAEGEYARGNFDIEPAEYGGTGPST